MSRRLFAVPTKSKETGQMIDAFKALFEQMPSLPWRLFSDKGSELDGPRMVAFFKKMDVKKHVSQSDDKKACVAERGIQTLKHRLYRYLTDKLTTRWVDVVPRIVDAINKSKCRVTGMRPLDMTPFNWQPVWHKLYDNNFKESRQDPRYDKGTPVRIDLAKKTFEKSYLPNYTQEVFKIRSVKRGTPTSYQLEDRKGEHVLGKFYRENFSRAKLPVKRIANVWDTRKRRGKMEYWVTYVDEDPRAHEWITEADLVEE